MRGIPPWGKRRARAQVAGIAARTVPGNGVCGGETLVRSIRGAERCGGGAWGGVSPPHGRRWRGSRSDARYSPVGEAPRTRTSRRNRCPYRSGNRAGCFSDGVCGGETLVRSIRGAERCGGGAWGGVSPPHGRRWRGSRSDARYPPVGEAPRTRTSRRNRCPYRSGNRAGCFFPTDDGGAPPVGEAPRTRTSRRNRCPYRSGNRAGCFPHGGLTSCAVPPAGKTVPQDRGPTDLPHRGPCPERIDCSGVSWPPFRRIPGSTRTPCRG